VEKPKTIGVSNGFLTQDGKLLLQVRTNNSWMGKVLGKTYEGLWELNGGMVQEKDIMKALTLPVLGAQAIDNAKNKLGITMTVPEYPSVGLTILKNEEKGILDWAFVLVVPPDCWQPPSEWPRDIIFVDMVELNAMTRRPEGEGQLVSGWGKRQHRMSLFALSNAFIVKNQIQGIDYSGDPAMSLLNQLADENNDYFTSLSAEESLKYLREAIH
jgi:hypothetical protein